MKPRSMRRIFVAIALAVSWHAALAQSDEEIQTSAQKALKAYAITSMDLLLNMGL